MTIHHPPDDPEDSDSAKSLMLDIILGATGMTVFIGIGSYILRIS